MKKKKRGINIKISLTNRWLYTFIAIGILAIISVGVYAFGTANPPVFGHSAGEIDLTAGTVGAIKSCYDSSKTKCVQIGYGGVNGYMDMNGTGTLDFRHEGSTKMSLYDNGNLNVVGSITASSFIYSSDKALKENIQPLQNSLNNILQLQGVSFNWIDTGQASIGLIAQDVEKVYPEIVSGNSDGIKSIDYGKLIAPLIEAIKKQQAQIEALQKEIDELKSK